MFDSHCHLDLTAEDPDTCIARAHRAGVSHMMVAGVDPSGWRRQLDWVRPTVLLGIGLHPWWAARNPDGIDAGMDELHDFVDRHRPRVHAIGETGLDFGQTLPRANGPAQQRAFGLHIDAAVHFGLPLILHVVRAHGVAHDRLRSSALPDRPGVIHSFSGSAEVAMNFVRMGFLISFSGAVTNPNRTRLHRAVRAVPDEFLLVETDSPDQTPWNRRPGPNHPAFLIDVISTIGAIRDQSPERIAQITADNAIRLFAAP